MLHKPLRHGSEQCLRAHRRVHRALPCLSAPTNTKRAGHLLRCPALLGVPHAEGGSRTPTGCYAHWILSPARLPIPPLPRGCRTPLSKRRRQGFSVYKDRHRRCQRKFEIFPGDLRRRLKGRHVPRPTAAGGISGFWRRRCRRQAQALPSGRPGRRDLGSHRRHYRND